MTCMDARDDLQCRFDDARRQHLRDGIRMSTEDKIAFFEGMLKLAAASGALARRRRSIQPSSEQGKQLD